MTSPSAISLGQIKRHERRLEQCETVLVGPIRDRYLVLKALGEVTAGEIARRMHEAGHEGFMRKTSPSDKKRYRRVDVVADTTRVERMLGVKATQQGTKNGKRRLPTLSKYLKYEFAVTLAQILGMDPVDAGV